MHVLKWAINYCLVLILHGCNIAEQWNLTHLSGQPPTGSVFRQSLRVSDLSQFLLQIKKQKVQEWLSCDRTHNAAAANCPWKPQKKTKKTKLQQVAFSHWKKSIKLALMSFLDGHLCFSWLWSGLGKQPATVWWPAANIAPRTNKPRALINWST